MSRRRPSGLNKHERKFASATLPDGRPIRIPQAKDAMTVFFFSDSGEWPEKAVGSVLYDMTWLTEGTVFEVQEMRPGHGMGELSTYYVRDVRARLHLHDGSYMQVERQVLCVPTANAESLTLKALEEGES